MHTTRCHPALAALLLLTLGLTTSRGAALDEPQDIAITATADGSEQRYVEWLPPGFNIAATNHVLLAFHGHGSDRWQFL